MGADIKLGTHAIDFLVEDGDITGVITNTDAIMVDKVVIAAGVGTKLLASGMGADIPLLHKPAYIALTEVGHYLCASTDRGCLPSLH